MALQLDFTDETYATVPMSIVTTVQSGVAIMVASGVLMRPPLDRFLDYYDIRLGFHLDYHNGGG